MKRIQKAEDNWLAASPDGVVEGLVYGLHSRGVLEIKCPFFNGDKSIAFPWSRVPLHCIPQAQGLMEIMEMQRIIKIQTQKSGGAAAPPRPPLNPS